MDDQELHELQNADDWDDKHDEILPPAKAPCAVVSVAFPRQDFAHVAERARRQGMTTAEFIR